MATPINAEVAEVAEKTYSACSAVSALNAVSLSVPLITGCYHEKSIHT